jgi:hypothetical protein
MGHSTTTSAQVEVEVVVSSHTCGLTRCVSARRAGDMEDDAGPGAAPDEDNNVEPYITED